jgi:uncharacterized membrane protein YeaQ/YmgE (transglycosylase-associated protein family)
MPIISWIVLGLIAGFIASRVINKTGEGLFRDLGLGIIGAIVGGWLVNILGMAGVTGLNLWSVLLSVAGAVISLIVYHALQGTSSRRAV